MIVLQENKSLELFIIAGCNGSGKTTTAFKLLPDFLFLNEFINADEIARGLSPFNSNSVAIKAGRLMLERIDELIENKKSFAFETTLATRSFNHLIHEAKESGYSINLIYFWLQSEELAIERVKDRVSKGGHSIPIEIITRRYRRSLQNLFQIYLPIVDNWIFLDNSMKSPILVAEKEQIQNIQVWQDLMKGYE